MKADNFLQSKVQQLTKSFFDKNPKVLKKYVNFGINAVGLVAVPLNKLMRHLVVVQGVDPDSTPGAVSPEILEAALLQSFNKIDDKDYESDYSVSWAHSKIKMVQNKLPDLNLTKESYHKITDLSNAYSPEHTCEPNTPNVAQTVNQELDANTSNGDNLSDEAK